MHPESVGGEVLTEATNLRWGAAEAVDEEHAAVTGAQLEGLEVARLGRVAEDALSSSRHARILT
jgi:hypothetical protein